MMERYVPPMPPFIEKGRTSVERARRNWTWKDRKRWIARTDVWPNGAIAHMSVSQKTAHLCILPTVAPHSCKKVYIKSLSSFLFSFLFSSFSPVDLVLFLFSSIIHNAALHDSLSNQQCPAIRLQSWHWQSMSYKENIYYLPSRHPSYINIFIAYTWIVWQQAIVVGQS